MLPHVEKKNPPRVRLLLQDATLFEMWFRVQLARWNSGDLRTCELQPQSLRSDVTPLHHFWHATNQQPRTCDPDWSSTWEHPNRDLQETVQLVGETGSFFRRKMQMSFHWKAVKRSQSHRELQRRRQRLKNSQALHT